LTLEFLDLSLGALSGVTVKMTDNSRALFRTKPQELLAGEGKALACFFQRHGRRSQTESVKLVSQFLDLVDSVRAPPFQELVT